MGGTGTPSGGAGAPLDITPKGGSLSDASSAFSKAQTGLSSAAAALNPAAGATPSSPSPSVTTQPKAMVPQGGGQIADALLAGISSPESLKLGVLLGMNEPGGKIGR